MICRQKNAELQDQVDVLSGNLAVVQNQLAVVNGQLTKILVQNALFTKFLDQPKYKRKFEAFLKEEMKSTDEPTASK